MAKKNFDNTFDRVIGKKPAAAEPAPQQIEEPKKKTPTAQQPVFSFRIDPDIADMIKDYAYTKRISIKDAVELMVETFIDDYESDPSNEPLLSHKK